MKQVFHGAALALTLLLGPVGCKKDPPPTPPSAATPAEAIAQTPERPASAAVAAKIDRQAWNRRAAALNLPLFRIADDQPADLSQAIAVLWRSEVYGGYRNWNELELQEADTRIVADLAANPSPSAGEAGPDASADAPRKSAVLRELNQSRPTLLLTDLSADATRTDGTIEMIRHVLKAANVVEKLYARQGGVLDLAAQATAADVASAQIVYRNQGPWCEAPQTEKDPDCHALADKPKKISGLYPADVQADPKFCETLAARPDGKQLMAPFSVVQYSRAGPLTAVPYHVAWAADMAEVATELNAAAQALTDPKEQAFRTYLRAAAKAFVSGDWPAADEAWAKMTVDNSRFYLRIGPDETYHEPCSQKAGFHVSFARIDQASRKWQQMLDPVKNQMEVALATAAGPPYVARKVSFHLPDFIEIILNAGDSRSPFGATIGQSLPNWGAVASEGRGRTVAMVNVGSDPDSRTTIAGQVASLFCAETFALFTTDPEPQRMSTVLHEAAHNLGPAHEYAVNGKKDGEAFGGPLAATLEELKAQTAAMYLADWLAAKGLISDTDRTQAHISDLAWAMGHIANGMHDAQGKPKPYSQLAAIQFGTLLKSTVVQWRPEAKAQNGTDTGCFAVDSAKMPVAVAGLMKEVAGIKSRGDKAAALALRVEFVEAEGPWATLRQTIRERWLRAAKASYVYAVRGL
ncbi:MAG: hypothetical protein EXR77_01895 [Myxococcales bacterium]|nr:hypothetical protein [Myxococcales bacterium]